MGGQQGQDANQRVVGLISPQRFRWGDIARLRHFIDCRFEEFFDLFRGDLGMVWKHFRAGALLAPVHSRRPCRPGIAEPICNRCALQRLAGSVPKHLLAPP
jgi:hypothetical protein